MSREDLISTIETNLLAVTREGATTAYFEAGKVKHDRPLALSPFDRQCIFYSDGEGDLPDAYRNGTLSRSFISERFVIKVFWQPAPLSGTREARTLEEWDVRRAITAALRADSQLGGNCSDLKIRSVTQEPERFGANDAEWDVLTIAFDVWDLTGEAITA